MLCCVVETEDDHVAEAVQRARRIKLDIELALALTDDTYTSTIKERNIVFTLFYLPCKHSHIIVGVGAPREKLPVSPCEKHPERSLDFIDCSSTIKRYNPTLLLIIFRLMVQYSLSNC